MNILIEQFILKDKNPSGFPGWPSGIDPLTNAGATG